MIDLPLFPLHTVLFPGTPVGLNVFEPRYKTMIGQCLEHEEPFGVALIRDGREALGPLPEPHAVGCTARIVDAQPGDGGRMEVTAVGVERFRIAALRRDRGLPYLVGEVELFPLAAGDPAAVPAAEGRLRRWVERYLRVLVRASEGDFTFRVEQLPVDAAALAFLAASILPLPAREKQPLLAVPTLVDLLRIAASLYQRELSVLENMVDHRHVTQAGPFSRN